MNALVLAGGKVIRPEHLSLGGSTVGEPTRMASLNEIEAAHVERVMTATGGNKAEAARVLGVSRPRLDRLLKRHGLH